jgi:hypothetical protein
MTSKGYPMSILTNRLTNRFRSRRGSSTLEFIFCAPLLVAMMFIAMEINERIEQRVTSAIAAGNAAWIAKVDPGMTGDQTSMHDLVKADVLGTRAGSGPALGIQSGASASGSETVLSYTDTKRRADTYDVHIKREQSDAARNRMIDRSSVALGDSNMDKVMAKMAQASGVLMKLWDKVTNPTFLQLPPIFPTSAPEEYELSWNIAAGKTDNALISIIEKLAQSVDKNQTSPIDPTSNTYRVLAHHTSYIKRDAGYHPSEYRLQAALGIAFGGCNQKFSDFNDKCFMTLKADKNTCGEDNGYVDYLYKIYLAVVTGKTILDAGVIACIAASLGLGSGTCNIPQIAMIAAEEGLKQLGQKKLEDALTSAVKGKMEDVVTKASCGGADSLKSGLTPATNSFDGEKNNVLTEFGK